MAVASRQYDPWLRTSMAIVVTSSFMEECGTQRYQVWPIANQFGYNKEVILCGSEVLYLGEWIEFDGPVYADNTIDRYTWRRCQPLVPMFVVATDVYMKCTITIGHRRSAYISTVERDMRGDPIVCRVENPRGEGSFFVGALHSKRRTDHEATLVYRRVDQLANGSATGIWRIVYLGPPVRQYPRDINA